MFKPHQPRAVLYCCTTEQPSLNEAEREMTNFHLHKGLPTMEVIQSLGPNPIIVFDDIMEQVMASRQVADIFTKHVHHLGLTVIFVVQNLYEQGRNARTIALNCNYIVIFKHVRDKTQLVTLGRQTFPGKPQKIVEALDDVTRENPRGYLVLDNTCTGDEKTRLRTNIFPGEYPIIYL